MSKMKREFNKNMKKVIKEDYQEDVFRRDAWWEKRDAASAKDLGWIIDALNDTIEGMEAWNQYQAEYAEEFEDDQFEYLAEEPQTKACLEDFYKKVEYLKKLIAQNDYLR